MAYRPQLAPTQVFVAPNNDMSGNLESLVTIKNNMPIIGYGISWSGTAPVGVIQCLCSNDYSIDAEGNVKNAGTWNIVPFSVSGTIVTSLPVSGSPGNGYIDIDVLSAYAIKLSYTATSGSGKLSALITGMVS